MNHSVKLNFETSLNRVTTFCPTCNIATPFESMTCGIDIDLDPAAETYQLDVQMHHAFPYEIGEDPRTIFMGMVCPFCGGVMTVVDTGVAPFIKFFNKVKLFTQFSCEGHYNFSTDPVTEINAHSIDTSYIKFIGNGKLIKDILLYNLVVKNRGGLVQLSDSEWSIDPMFSAGPYGDLSVLSNLVWDDSISGLYARRPTELDQKSFDIMQSNFSEAMYKLCYHLPEFIRAWYNECEDDDKYFFDTLEKKDQYTKVWADDMSLRSIVIGKIYDEEDNTDE